MSGFQKASPSLNQPNNLATPPQHKASDMIAFRALLISLSAVSAFAAAADRIIARSELADSIAVSAAADTGIARSEMASSSKAEYCYLCSDGLG